MGYTIMEIEDAILTALNASELKGTCQTIAPYHGEIDDLMEDVKKMILPFPAVFTLYAGSGFAEPANRAYEDEALFTVVVIAKDLRGGNSLRAAVYPMIETCKQTLIDNPLGLDISPLKPVRIAPVFIGKLFSIYGFDLSTWWRC
ncbi:MAG: DUF1834 family protein [Nitrospirales bacterium]|nr:DUF1834 family protein [Nitrospirales bacterium]